MKRLLILGAAALACTPLLAQYKVIGPDGKVTYTDRPLAGVQGQVSNLRRPGNDTASATTPLPPELRDAATRFPVVLYTTTDCAPCDSARRMLKQRGIPLTERQVLNNDDLLQVERSTGGRAMPAMTVGAQPLNGYSASAWHDLLDLAGYPRESRLPKDYQAAAPTPLTPRPATPPPPAANDLPARSLPPPAPAPETAPTPGGIRF